MARLTKQNIVKSVDDLQELLGGKHPLSDIRLGEVLVGDRIISSEQLSAALARPKKGRNKHLGQILLIEDNPGDAYLIQATLTDVKGFLFNIKHADRLSAGFKQLQAGGIDL